MERFKKLMEQIEKEVNSLSEDNKKLENDPTAIKLDVMRKDIKKIRAKITEFSCYLNSFRIW